MNIEQKKLYLIQLQKELSQLSSETLEELHFFTKAENGWFTPENIELALAGILEYLQEKNLQQWFEKYPTLWQEPIPKKIGVVMAGNIPAVGFHDYLAVLVSGHKLLAKLSSQNQYLLKWLHQQLEKIAPEWAANVQFVERLNDAEAIIATGSDNSARYFAYYFAQKPHIIRKNRNACAILNGKETQTELANLGADIFQYFGLGCRSVSKVYVPEGYDFTQFFQAVQPWQTVINHHKYVNNYDYQKSILLVNGVAHQDNGFLLVKESEELASSISVLHYQTYQNTEHLEQLLTSVQEKIQCVVASEKSGQKAIPFGQAQKPQLWDYADGVDTLDFLLHLS